ncbi:MAG TPA: HNH endonuclease signature motif containing protein, partial [Microbacteriaceae bacterium]
DGRCRFPTCNRNPRRTELDHTVDWHYGGKTQPDNLACLCKGDHRLKHQTRWRVRQVSPGVLEWTSPHGRIITDHPDRDIPGSTIDTITLDTVVRNTLGDTDPPPF